jgi:hypothetical protein
MPFRPCSRLVTISLVIPVTFCGKLQAEIAPADVTGARGLRDQIAALSPSVHVNEAQRVAESAYATAERLRRDYAVTGPPLFHNFLVNIGIRKRGLCFQWAEDLLAQLDALKLTTLELHWAEARAGSLREHNCVVVTAKGQPFGQGIILDCWRHSGRLFWSPLATDHYPWIENDNYAKSARARVIVALATTKKLPRRDTLHPVPNLGRHGARPSTTLQSIPRSGMANTGAAGS